MALRPVARRAVPKATFVSQLAAERTRLGALAGRGQPTITRVKYSPGAAVPEGLYINVSFPTRFANSAQPVRELVSASTKTRSGAWPVTACARRHPEEMNDGN